MNEPACFNNTEQTFPKTNLQTLALGNEPVQVEHREIHNLYGYFHTMATHQALKQRNSEQANFVLTRSFFAGSQKYSAVWSGDCRSDWEHFKGAVPILLQIATCGISFIGCDVPGFFKDPPDEDLVVRWYQLGAFLPFFRAHAHRRTKKREPWTFSKETQGLISQAIRMRYELLPFW